MSLATVKNNRALAMVVVVIMLLVIIFHGQYQVQAAGVNYYVSLSGHDYNNDGKSIGSAFRTIKKAVTVAGPGDIVNVSDGTYYEGEIAIANKAGSETNRLVVKATNKQKAKIVSNSAYHAIAITGSTGITIDGFEVTFSTTNTSKHHGINAQGNWITIKNCYIHDAPFSGIQGYLCDNVLIENNTLQDNCKKTDTENGSGISIYHPVPKQANAGFHIIIRNNIIFENEATNNVGNYSFPTDGNGIIMDDFHCVQSSGSDVTHNLNYPYTSLIENNLVFNNGGRGIHVFSSDNVTVRNNTCWYNGYILNRYNDLTPGELSIENGINNKFYNNIAVQDPSLTRMATMRVYNDNDTTEIKSNVLAGETFLSWWDTNTRVNTGSNTGNLTNRDVTYPKFINPTKSTGWNFRLQSISPAINTGNNTYAATNVDLDGNTRIVNSIIDMGCYEYGEVIPTPPPTTQSLDASNTTSTITIDGNLDSAWSGKVTSDITKVVTGAVSSTSDLSGKYGLLWDSTNLYAMFDITDDTKKNDSGTSWWDDDGVELYIDANNNGGTTYGTDDFQYAFRWNDTTIRETKRNAITGVQFAKVDTTGGYRIEVKIPWSTLGKTPTADMIMGLDAGIGDDDDGSTRDGKKMWNSYDDNAWQYPDRFGKCKLIGTATQPVTLTIQAESYNTMSGITKSGTVIGSCDNNDWVCYNNLNLGTGVTKLTTYMATSANGYTAEVRDGSTTGTLLGTLTVSSTGGYSTYVEKTATLTGASGTKNIYIVFKGGYGVGNFDWFKFSNN